MQIASQHAEAISKPAGISVEERLLLDRIALHSAHVSPRDVELPALVVADLAHPRLSLSNGTAVPTGVAAQAVVVNWCIKFAFSGNFDKDFTVRGKTGASA